MNSEAEYCHDKIRECTANLRSEYDVEIKQGLLDEIDKMNTELERIYS